jgi:hypothetical protein
MAMSAPVPFRFLGAVFRLPLSLNGVERGITMKAQMVMEARFQVGTQKERSHSAGLIVPHSGDTGGAVTLQCGMESGQRRLIWQLQMARWIERGLQWLRHRSEDRCQVHVTLNVRRRAW